MIEKGVVNREILIPTSYLSAVPITLSERVKVTQSCLTLCNPMDYTVHRSLNARIMDWVTFPSPGVLPNPGIEPRSPSLQADSLPAEPQGKPKNIRVGSLSPTPVNLPNSGIELGSPALQVDSLPAELSEKPNILSKSK